MPKEELIQLLDMHAQLHREEKKLRKEIELLSDYVTRGESSPYIRKKESIGKGILRYIRFTGISFAILPVIVIIILFVGIVINPSDGWANNLSGLATKLIPPHPVLSYLLTCCIVCPIIMFPPCALYHIVYSLTYKKLNEKSKRIYEKSRKDMIPYEKKLQSMKQRLDTIDNQKKVISQKLGITSGTLWSSDLAYYLKSGRADTLKEALRLLDAGLESEAQESREKQFQQQVLEQGNAQIDALNAIHDDAARAADAAEDAAFWGKARTFILADSIDKIKKNKE